MEMTRDIGLDSKVIDTLGKYVVRKGSQLPKSQLTLVPLNPNRKKYRREASSI